MSDNNEIVIKTEKVRPSEMNDRERQIYEAGMAAGIEKGKSITEDSRFDQLIRIACAVVAGLGIFMALYNAINGPL